MAMYDLVTRAGAAAMLGVSKQRARELFADNDDFPSPVGTVDGKPVFDRGEMLDYAARRNRRPGRPAKPDTMAPWRNDVCGECGIP